MNPTTPVGSIGGVRVSWQQGDARNRRDANGQAFRDALQQEEREPQQAQEERDPGAGPGPDRPTPSRLQPRAPVGRNRTGAAARHVDVVA